MMRTFFYLTPLTISIVTFQCPPAPIAISPRSHRDMLPFFYESKQGLLGVCDDYSNPLACSLLAIHIMGHFFNVQYRSQCSDRRLLFDPIYYVLVSQPLATNLQFSLH